MNAHAQKLLIIVGPTASGKSDLAVELALRHNGEVISADSRQVYRGMDIGTGKITHEEMRGVPHHCLDIADPSERFTVADWKTAAEAAIADIVSRGKLPIVCGGTGFYIDTLVNGSDLPDIDTDPEEQAQLEAMPIGRLQAELERLDPRRAADMRTNGSFANPRRVARAILIARKLGAVPSLSAVYTKAETRLPISDTLWIGILPPDALIRERISKRLLKRLDSGMIGEAQRLHASGVSYERMEELGLEYRYLARFLQGQIDREQLIAELSTKIWQYARRQKTWWKRNKSIRWFPSLQAAVDTFSL